MELHLMSRASECSSEAPRYPGLFTCLGCNASTAHVRAAALDANTTRQNMSSTPGRTRMAYDGRSIDPARAA